MRVNLIFTPFVSPSCVPIGLASLKSYVERNIRGVNIKTIDLDIEFVNHIAKGNVKEVCNVCLAKDSSGCWAHLEKFNEPYQIPDELKERFLIAKKVVKDSRAFYNKNLFVWSLLPLFKFTKRYSNCVSSVLHWFLEERITDENFIYDLLRIYIERAIDGNPELIGFSALTNDQTDFALAMAKIIRERYKIPVLFGGPGFSHNFNPKDLMDVFDFIDFFIVKEGEEALLELVQKMPNENYDKVPNLIWRKNGKISFNKEIPITDLDKLPTPDFSDFALDEYYFPELILPISASRNCPWGICKFCALNTNYTGKYRVRSVKHILGDIRSLQEKYGVKYFFFTDSEIAPRRFKEIGQAISEAGVEAFFGCYARPTKSLNFEALKAAYEGGFRYLHVGIESFSNRVLGNISKGTTRDSIQTFLKNANDLNMTVLCYMLATPPTQTREELMNDLKEIAFFQRKYKNILLVTYSVFNLGKFMRFFDERKDYGIKITEKIPAFEPISSKKVYLENVIQFRYDSNGPYDILGNDHHQICYASQAQNLLDKKMKKLGINQKDAIFINLINNFLFETQLLYAKRFAESLPQRMSGFVKQLISH